MYKKWFTATFSTFAIGFSAFGAWNPKPYIISGFDDVLRQAENTSLVKAAIRLAVPDKTFSGMSELYSVISSEEADPKFVLISGISCWFDSRVDQLLTKHQYPSRSLYLRSWVLDPSLETFKMEHVQQVISQQPNRKFIVIFDNSDPSLDLAESIHSAFADRVEAIYLRSVVAKTVPSGATLFYTAFDIALNEYQSQRLSAAEVRRVASAILRERERKNLFPSYSICPRDYNPCQDADAEINEVCEQVRTHVLNFCKSDFL